MSDITANDLKTRGIAAIQATLAEQPEAVVSVRGTGRYVVMEISRYHYLRECELEVALAQSRSDIAEGRYVKESPEDHVMRAQAMIAVAEAVGSARSAAGAAEPGRRRKAAAAVKSRKAAAR